MLVREYLKHFNKPTNVTFIKAIARKDVDTPYCHAEYQTTPIRTIEDWKESDIMDYYILNNKQSPIEWISGSFFKHAFDSGRFFSLLVISKEDLEKLYSEKQAVEIIKYIDERIKENM